MSKTGLKIECLKSYDGFQLEVDETLSLGGITAIFGPSGSGKTSLLKLIAGLECPDEGHILFKDQFWFRAGLNIEPQKREAGYLFQSGALFSHLTVFRNLTFADKRSRHIDNGITFDGVVQALDLKPLLQRKPQTLSGGERRRVALGRIVLSRPKILLLDEPLTGLDRARKRELLPLIKTLATDFKIPCLYVSHDIEEVITLVDRLLILKDGRVHAHGPATDVLNQIDTLPLSTLNIAPGTVFDARVSDIINGMIVLKMGEVLISLPAERQIEIGAHKRIKIRSQDVSIAIERPQNISIQNCLGGTISHIEPIEGTVFFDISLKLHGTDKVHPNLKSRITKNALEKLQLTVGSPVFALVKTASLQH